MNLRDQARGRGCMIRLAGVSGMGIKADDLLGAWACSSCHDAVDRRSYTDLERDYVRLAHLEGVVRTIAVLRREGLI